MATTDVEEATKDVEIAVMVGGFPRKAGMERKDVMSKNVSIYKSQASALEKNAKSGVKVCPIFCRALAALWECPLPQSWSADTICHAKSSSSINDFCIIFREASHRARVH